MCYSGRCKYEDHEGSCQLPWSSDEYPGDAYCMLTEQEIAEQDKLLEELDVPA